MAAPKTLNAKNLERLGAPRLAELLMGAANTAVAKRMLRVELAASFGPELAVQEVRKRLASLRKGGGALTLKRSRAFVAELAELWDATARLIGPDAPWMAAELAFELLGMATTLERRGVDGAAPMQALTDTLLPELPAVLQRADLQTEALVSMVETVLEQEVGLLNRAVIDASAAALGTAGLQTLSDMLLQACPPSTSSESWQVKRQRRHYEDALRALADVQGDADAFAATLGVQDLTRPDSRGPVCSARCGALRTALHSDRVLRVEGRFDGNRGRSSRRAIPALDVF
jgi:hypothetical protein